MRKAITLSLMIAALLSPSIASAAPKESGTPPKKNQKFVEIFKSININDSRSTVMLKTKSLGKPKIHQEEYDLETALWRVPSCVGTIAIWRDGRTWVNISCFSGEDSWGHPIQVYEYSNY